MATLREVLGRLPSVSIGVIGDLIADEYIYTRPARLSREAPVLVVRYESEETVPGGAANTARNLAALGCRVHLVGLLGDDPAGARVRTTLREEGVGDAEVLISRTRATVTKTRILSGDVHRTKQQLFRIDRDPTTVSADLEEEVLARLERLDSQVGNHGVLERAQDGRVGQGPPRSRRRQHVLRLAGFHSPDHGSQSRQAPEVTRQRRTTNFCRTCQPGLMVGGKDRRQPDL